MIRPKKKRPASTRFFLREADALPRPPRGCFDWRPFEIVIGQPKPPLPPAEMRSKSDG
jgi:hypothetical protein